MKKKLILLAFAVIFVSSLLPARDIYYQCTVTVICSDGGSISCTGDIHCYRSAIYQIVICDGNSVSC